MQAISLWLAAAIVILTGWAIVKTDILRFSVI